MSTPISFRNRMIYLERRLAFIEDKLKTYENAEGPIVNILPVKVYDIIPLYEQTSTTKGSFLLVLFIRRNDKRCPIIKVSEKTLKQLAYSEETITIDDYIHTETFAEKTICERKWIWKRR